MTDSNKTPAPAPGELSLDVLVQSMEPVLYDEVYVFATVDKSFNSDAANPLMRFSEQEGDTLILTQAAAVANNLAHEFACRMITLNIHSSLEAVGFLARITQRLAAQNMGVNPVSGFYHDHLFVPADRAEDALTELRLMSNQSG